MGKDKSRRCLARFYVHHLSCEIRLLFDTGLLCSQQSGGVLPPVFGAIFPIPVFAVNHY